MRRALIVAVCLTGSVPLAWADAAAVTPPASAAASPTPASPPSTTPALPDRPGGVSPDTRAPSTGAPDTRAQGGVPRDGVVQPAPDATHDLAVKPPNVDPAMAIPPPGTPGGDPTVKPK